MSMKTVEKALNLEGVFADKAFGLYVPNGAPDPKQIKTLFARASTNCYSGSLAIPLRGLACPGFLKESVKRFTFEEMITAQSVHRGLLRDGLEEINPDDVDKYGVDLDKHVIAAFVKPNQDFHFWALCNDGNYYAKQGKYSPFFDKKSVGSVKDLLTGWHPDFVGTYAVPEQGLEYYQRLSRPSIDTDKVRELVLSR